MECNNHSGVSHTKPGKGQPISVQERMSYAQQNRDIVTYEDNTVETLLEPSHGVLLLHPVLRANTGLLLLPPCYPSTWPAHNDVEVHTENTDTRVVPGTEIDVLLDTETEVAGLREVLAVELVLLDLETALKNLLGLGTADGDMNGDFFVPSDGEGSDGVSCLRGHGCLTGELLEHLGCTGQTITGLAHGDVCMHMEGARSILLGHIGDCGERTEDELVDANLLHGVGGGGLLFGLAI